MPVEVAVAIPLIGDERRKNWAKIVTSVDTDKATGWAFDGPFIAPGGIQDIPVGAVVLVYGEKGSATSPRPEARLYTTNPEGSLTLQGQATGRAWARTLRDKVSELLAPDRPIDPSWITSLSLYPAEVLAEELQRRGYVVRAPDE